MKTSDLMKLNKTILSINEFTVDKNGTPIHPDNLGDIAKKHGYTKVSNNKYVHSDKEHKIISDDGQNWQHVYDYGKVEGIKQGNSLQDLDAHLTKYHSEA